MSIVIVGEIELERQRVRLRVRQKVTAGKIRTESDTERQMIQREVTTKGDIETERLMETERQMETER